MDYLLILRGFAALAVMLRHLPLTWPEAWWGDFGWVLDPFGYIPVLMFFALSGYLISKNFLDNGYALSTPRGWGDYYRNRALRILPLYYASILFCVGVYWDRAVAEPERVWNLFIFVENQQNAARLIFNWPYWTIVIEVWFYLLAPVLVLLAAWFNRWLGWGGWLLAILLGYFVYGLWLFQGFAWQGSGVAMDRATWNALAHHDFFYNLEAFLIGMHANFALRGRWRAWLGNMALRRWLWAVLVVGIAAVTMRGYFVGDPLFRQQQVDVFTLLGLVPSVGLLVWLLATLQDSRESSPAHGGYWRRGLEGLGLISYGIYLWHVPIMHLTERWGGHELGAVGFSLLVIGLTLAWSTLSYVGIERTFMRFRARRRSAKNAARIQ